MVHLCRKNIKKVSRIRVIELIHDMPNILHVLKEFHIFLYTTFIFPHIYYCRLSWRKRSYFMLFVQKGAVYTISAHVSDHTLSIYLTFLIN